MTRKRIATALGIVLLAACGGGELIALLPIVGPIGGQWVLDTERNTPVLDDTKPDEFFNVSAVGDDAFPYPTESAYTVFGNFGSASGPCKADFVGDSVAVDGEVNGDLLVLTRDDDPTVDCLRARYIDVRTIEVSATGERYRNNTVQFELSKHEWVNTTDTTQRFKFTTDSTVLDGNPPATFDLVGCRRSGNPPVTVPFSGTLVGFNTATAVGPQVVGFTIGGTAFGAGEFKSPSLLEFGANGGNKLTLRRELVPQGGQDIVCP